MRRRIELSPVVRRRRNEFGVERHAIAVRRVALLLQPVCRGLIRPGGPLLSKPKHPSEEAEPTKSASPPPDRRWRMTPPARDQVRLAELGRAVRSDDPFDYVLTESRRRLRQLFGARAVVLTGSGTQALTAALRIAFREQRSRRVAMPAWGCYALASAAVGAGADSVVFYDLDPRTLAADPSSLNEALAEGARTVVLAHLYGFPAATGEILERVREAGAIVVEDAAQGIGGALDDAPLGALGAMSVLSFGRGKGATCGGGGALLLHDSAPRGAAAEELGSLRDADGDARSGGWRELGVTAAQWAFARPGLYRIPASVPFLGLGETRYRPPSDPEPMAERPVRLLREILRKGLDHEPRRRQKNARRLQELVEDAPNLPLVRPVEGGTTGALRFPCLLPEGSPGRPSLGVLPGYPRLLFELGVLPASGTSGRTSTPGARELRDRLHTAPVHGGVKDEDLQAVARWLRNVVSRENRS